MLLKVLLTCGLRIIVKYEISDAFTASAWLFLPGNCANVLLKNQRKMAGVFESPRYQSGRNLFSVPGAGIEPALS